jgi:hypothetical protein
MITARGLAVVSSLALSSSALAQNAVQWRAEDGGNGHWYGVATNPLGAVHWRFADAAAHAIAQGAHLATFSNQTENTQVYNMLQLGSGYFAGWFGLVQAAGSQEPSGGWGWITNEPMLFDFWQPGEPTNAGCYQPSAPQSWGILEGNQSGGNLSGRWDDDGDPVPACQNVVASAVIEWDADCNSDGIVDYGQCRDGSLPDYNGNNTPDCCEQGTNCVVGNYPVQWRVEDGGNGHWYQAIPVQDWYAASASAAATNAHLASILSSAENSFVTSMLASTTAFRGYIGLEQLPGQPLPNIGWRWATGELLGFSNWTDFGGSYSFVAPDDTPCNTPPYFVEDGQADIGMIALDGKWDDLERGQLACNIPWSHVAIVEWSTDCNEDGLVDVGQIRRGQLADANANNIPDICESITVPTHFATVQAAIDSVATGAHRVIRVLPGTYNQSFSLNGKDVVIRGAADGTTILDGTGLPASIATFSGGEPATAGLENLVFRNGTVGSLIYKGALFKVGGAVYGTNSSAFIRNCRFENNRSDYGGAVYLIYSSFLAEGCVFSGNTGVSQGGGMMVFGSTGAVRNCTFTANRCGVAGVGGGSAFKAAEALFTGETVLLDGCTITGNIAGVDGSAVEYHEDVGLHLGKMRLMNCTITGNTSGTITAIGSGGLTVTGRMQSCIIDAGTTICDNLPRNVQGPYFIAGTPTICDCQADLSGDGMVNGGDLGILLSSWGATLPTGVGDVNHDGVVNGADLAVLLSSWGSCP